MTSTAAGWLQAGLVAALAVSYRPLGDYMARILTTARHWRAERSLCKVIGVRLQYRQRHPQPPTRLITTGWDARRDLSFPFRLCADGPWRVPRLARGTEQGRFWRRLLCAVVPDLIALLWRTGEAV